MSELKPVVAAFDFDGTLTYHDSLLPFAIFIRGKLKSTFLLLLVLPWMLAFVLKIISRQSAKEKLLRSFFGGEHVETMNRWGEEFAKHGIPFLLRPAAMERFQWHKAQGHRCVIVSASIETYLKPWAKIVGFDDVLASRLEVKEQKVTGRLQGLNCWGPEKIQRLEELLGSKVGYVLYAYGDSKGDFDMLEIADYAYKKKFNQDSK